MKQRFDFEKEFLDLMVPREVFPLVRCQRKPTTGQSPHSIAPKLQYSIGVVLKKGR